MDKTRCHGTMTEAQYLSWIRSALRSKWLKWKPRSEILSSSRRKYKGENKSQKWEYSCAICNSWKPLKMVEVDHYPENAGSILQVEDIGKFCNNLFCEVDNLRVVCKECHSIYTLSQRNNVSLEVAWAQKKAIEFMKQPKEKQLAFLQEHNYTGDIVSNAAKRKVLINEIFLKEQNGS